jgi:hypothetical protein
VKGVREDGDRVGHQSTKDLYAHEGQ